VLRLKSWDVPTTPPRAQPRMCDGNGGLGSGVDHPAPQEAGRAALRRLLRVIALCAALAADCGRSGGHATASRVRLDPCALVTEDEAEAVLGRPLVSRLETKSRVVFGVSEHENHRFASCIQLRE